MGGEQWEGSTSCTGEQRGGHIQWYWCYVGFGLFCAGLWWLWRVHIWRECHQEYVAQKFLYDLKLVGIGMGHHVEVLVHSGAQLGQPIDHGIPMYMLWYWKVVIAVFSMMNWMGTGVLHGVFIIVICIIHGASSVDYGSWAIHSHQLIMLSMAVE